MTEGEDLKDIPVRSVARGIDVLLSLTEGPQALGWIAEVTELPKATAHRILASLAHRFIVLQDPETGMYALGPGCLSIVSAATQGWTGIGIEARPLLSKLQQKTGETITIHVRVRTHRVCVDVAASAHPIRYTVDVGTFAPIYVGAAGKVLLAFMEQRDRRQLLQGVRLLALGPETITKLPDLEVELEGVRRQGYATSSGERVSGASAVSAPIFETTGRVVAALSVLGPDNRMYGESLETARALVVAAAQRISTRMGSVGPS